MGTTWSDAKVKNHILEAAECLCLDRMPSRSELETFCGDTRLTNAIQRRGGFRYWARKVSLDLKESETKFGQDAEEQVIKLMWSKGFDCELTPTKHPYDILVEKCAKIDVKAARETLIRGYPSYSFRIAKPQQTCDFYILVPVGGDGEIIKTYIIPAHVVSGQKQICISTTESAYDVYMDRWDLIDKYVNAIRMITVR